MFPEASGTTDESVQPTRGIEAEPEGVNGTMRLGNLNKAIMRGGLSVVAALLLTTAGFAQDAATDEASAGPVVVQNWHDLNPGGDEGIAVGEPDPSGGDEGIAVGEPDPNGDDTAVDPGDDTSVDPGDDTATDPGDDQGGDDDPEIVIDDGLCIGADCTPEEGTVTTTADGGVIMYMNGGPDACINCNGMPVTTPGRSHNPRAVERSHTVPAVNHDQSDVALNATASKANCLAQHARATWICEWQNGAGQ